MAYSCPDCASPLSVSPVNGSRVLGCPSCRGRLYGLSPFERMLAEGVGARVWTGAEDGSAAGHCPYCSAPMRRPDGDADAAPGLCVCRMCQEVWVPASAADWMASHTASSSGGGAAAGAAVSAPVVPAECGNCGAPYEPDEDGKCHWCHAQIAAAQPVVVLVQPEPEPDWGLRLI